MVKSFILNGFCSQSHMEGTLLTREQVDAIASRISKTVSENIDRQLNSAIKLAKSTEKSEK